MMRLRRAIEADLDAIVALERAVATAPHWPLSSYGGILKAGEAIQDEHPSRCLFVAEQSVGEQSGIVEGFAVGLVNTGQADGEIESVVVAEGARRAGVGTRLCAAVLAWCRERGAETIGLEVRSTSGGAIALYTALGFERAGIRPGYYRDPEDDALTMRLKFLE